MYFLLVLCAACEWFAIFCDFRAAICRQSAAIRRNLPPNLLLQLAASDLCRFVARRQAAGGRRQREASKRLVRDVDNLNLGKFSKTFFCELDADA